MTNLPYILQELFLFCKENDRDFYLEVSKLLNISRSEVKPLLIGFLYIKKGEKNEL